MPHTDPSCPYSPAEEEAVYTILQSAADGASFPFTPHYNKHDEHHYNHHQPHVTIDRVARTLFGSSVVTAVATLTAEREQGYTSMTSIYARAAPLQKQIKRHYKHLALRVHPDKNKHPQAHEAFQQVQEAFEYLFGRLLPLLPPPEGDNISTNSNNNRNTSSTTAKPSTKSEVESPFRPPPPPFCFGGEDIPADTSASNEESKQPNVNREGSMDIPAPPFVFGNTTDLTSEEEEQKKETELPEENNEKTQTTHKTITRDEDKDNQSKTRRAHHRESSDDDDVPLAPPHVFGFSTNSTKDVEDGLAAPAAPTHSTPFTECTQFCPPPPVIFSSSSFSSSSRCSTGSATPPPPPLSGTSSPPPPPSVFNITLTTTTNNNNNNAEVATTHLSQLFSQFDISEDEESDLSVFSQQQQRWHTPPPPPSTNQQQATFSTTSMPTKKKKDVRKNSFTTTHVNTFPLQTNNINSIDHHHRNSSSSSNKIKRTQQTQQQQQQSTVSAIDARCSCGRAMKGKCFLCNE